MWDILSNISGFIIIFAIISASKIEADHVGLRASLVAQMVKNVQKPGSRIDPLEKEMATHFSTFFFFFN